jgi:alcohol dehydrogenase/propanol-preferring alcohol dehydrogenase
MRAALFERRGGPLELGNLAQPTPGADDVLIEVKAAGVCYTDLRLIDGSDRGDAGPIVPGHEVVGRVSEVGTNVAAFVAGDRVAVHALFSCGECEPCLIGEEEACARGVSRLAGFGVNGGYADFIVAPASHVVSLPDELSFEDAAPFCCAGLTVYAALRNGGIRHGQRVAIVGIGGLGHLAISIAVALGAEVYAVTGSPDKVELALERGALWAGTAPAAATELAQRGGAHLVLSTANDLAPIGQMLTGLAKQASIVLAAADGEALPIPLGMFVGSQLRVIGSFFGSTSDLRDVLELAAQHHIRPQIETYPLDAVNEVHARLRANEVRFRAVLTPGTH